MPGRPGVIAEYPDGDSLVVAPWGDDANPGTPELPFGTLEHALGVVAAGQTLFVRGGTYVEHIRNPPLHRGTESAPIRVTNYPGEAPVVQGLLWLKDPDFWTLSGINVTWRDGNSPEDHMVRIQNGVGWVLADAEFWGARSFAALLVAGTEPGEPSDWTVVGNCIHDTYAANDMNQDHNLYVNTGISAGIGRIEGNVVFNATNGTNIKLGGPGSEPHEGSAHVTVAHNTLVNASQPILLAGGTHDITIERNIIATSGYPWLIRGYRLLGADNVARDNLGAEAEALIHNDPGFTGVSDGGGNLFPHDPVFDAEGCAGFRPLDPTAQGYGP